ncbi:MAG: TPM domain-containing protein [Pseudomonadota bacterium]
MVVLSETDHQRVTEAVRAAESQTSGEIHCVVCRQSDPYFLAAGFYFSAGVLLIGFMLALFLERSWYSVTPLVLAGAQLAAWLAGLLVLWGFPSLRLLLVPRNISYRRAHAHAVQQFFARNIHTTGSRTGVLIFVSLAERYAEIIADNEISKQVSQDDWNAIVADLMEGARRHALADALITAVERSGDVLKTHFPARKGQKNELPDHVVEL